MFSISYGGEKMNRKLKYVGLFSLIPLLALSLTMGFGGDVAAENRGTISDGAGDHRHNLDTGQSVEKYLSESKASTPEAKVALTPPYFDLVDVQPASANSENLYNAIFDVWAGDTNITDLEMLVTSDMDSITTYTGSSMNAGDHSTTTVKIRALDPSSISGKIVGWNGNPGSQNHLGSQVSAHRVTFDSGTTIEAKSADGSYIELFDMVDLGSDMYKATFTYYAANDVPSGRVLKVTTDISTEFIPLPRIDAGSYDWFSVIIKANDPHSIMTE